MSYYNLREQVWPYGRLWGDREERKAVRNYLKKIWEENVDTQPVPYDTLETTRNEENDILQWWWTNRYRQPGKVNRNNQFGQWLLTQYHDSIKVNRRDNRQWGRN